MECFCEEEEEVDTESSEQEKTVDLPLVEVSLSSAQYGALVDESVRMFSCDCVCERCAHRRFCFMCLLCAYAHPAASLRVLRCARVSALASSLTPREVNIAAPGKAEPSGPEQSRTEQKQCNLHTDPSLYPINNTAPRRTA